MRTVVFTGGRSVDLNTAPTDRVVFKIQSGTVQSSANSSQRQNRDSVVVTGGSGFVGRRVVRTLVARGVPVISVDLKPFPFADGESIPDGLTTITGDLADSAIREQAINEHTDGIIHLAAATSVLQSIERPAATYANNVAITHELLERARQCEVEKFVFASTNAVVGDIGGSTINESLPLQPLTPYGSTKAACEMLLSGYAGAYGMQAAALRFTNIYGPGMSHKDSFVPRLMRAALTGEGVQVYGDGGQRRDFVHIDDVVRGILAALDKAYRGTAIIGSGQSITVLELLAAVRETTGKPVPAEHVPAKNGEMPAVIVDVSTADAELGYRPEIGLVDGLGMIWEDFQRHSTVMGASSP